jgi:hypothetical protein
MGSFASIFNGISANEFAVGAATFIGSMPIFYNILNGGAYRLPTPIVAGVALASFFGSDFIMNDGNLTRHAVERVGSSAQTLVLGLNG